MKISETNYRLNALHYALVRVVYPDRPLLHEKTLEDNIPLFEKMHPTDKEDAQTLFEQAATYYEHNIKTRGIINVCDDLNLDVDLNSVDLPFDIMRTSEEIELIKNAKSDIVDGSFKNKISTGKKLISQHLLNNKDNITTDLRERTKILIKKCLSLENLSA